MYQSNAQILSIQQCQMLLYTLNLGFFILFFAIYPVAYGVGFTLLGLPIVKWISNFKQQPIAGGQYFNRPISQTVFMLLIAINRAEHVCATVIIKHNYMLMCNHKIVINIMLCL